MTVRIEKVLDVKASIGEGAFWSAAENRLLWTDIAKGHLNRFDPETGRNEVFEQPSMLGCFAPMADGHVMLALEDGFFEFDPASGERKFITHPEPDRPENRFNDGTTDLAGRFWAGTMPKAGSTEKVAEGSLFCLDVDGSAQKHAGGFYTQNGLAFSPDGKIMYVSDSARWLRTIWAHDYDIETGTLSKKRVFFDTEGRPGRPDGGTIDADGCYWMAGVGGAELVRITPQGKVDRVIDMPVQKPTKIAFGGSNLDIMFVTSIGDGGNPAGRDPDDPLGGDLFAVHAGCQGVELAPFGGT